jgi:hypothetical protein
MDVNRRKSLSDGGQPPEHDADDAILIFWIVWYHLYLTNIAGTSPVLCTLKCVIHIDRRVYNYPQAIQAHFSTILNTTRFPRYPTMYIVVHLV